MSASSGPGSLTGTDLVSRPYLNSVPSFGLSLSTIATIFLRSNQQMGMDLDNLYAILHMGQLNLKRMAELMPLFRSCINFLFFYVIMDIDILLGFTDMIVFMGHFWSSYRKPFLRKYRLFRYQALAIRSLFQKMQAALLFVSYERTLVRHPAIMLSASGLSSACRGYFVRPGSTCAGGDPMYALPSVGLVSIVTLDVAGIP